MNNYLLDQAQEADQIRGRENQLRVNYRSGHMLYKAPNKVIFRIDTSPVGTGGEPIVTTETAEIYSASHRTHTLGGGRVCLAASLRGWELHRILLQIDSWARGHEIYKQTGKFPDSIGDVFKNLKSLNKPKKGFLSKLFS